MFKAAPVKPTVPEMSDDIIVKNKMHYEQATW